MIRERLSVSAVTKTRELYVSKSNTIECQTVDKKKPFLMSSCGIERKDQARDKNHSREVIMGRKRKVGEENFKDFHKFSFYLCLLISDSSQPKCFSETFLCFSFLSVSFFVFSLFCQQITKAQKCAAERLSGTHFVCQIPKKDFFSLFRLKLI